MDNHKSKKGLLKDEDENEMVLAIKEFCALEKELEASKISLA